MERSKKIMKSLIRNRKHWELAKAAAIKENPSRAGGWSKSPGSRSGRKS